MSNEELVSQVQAGDTERMEELWGQVKNFVARKARQLMQEQAFSTVVDLEDLVQSGYIGLVAAVRSYKPESGPFLPWLGYWLKNIFAETAGYRTAKQQNDPAKYALSVDAPMGEDGSGSFLDYAPDMQATADMEEAEDRVWNAQLRNALESVLDELPENYSEVVRLRYFQGQSLEQISQTRQVSKQRVQRLESEGIRKLKNPELACRLYPFLDYDFYCGTGLQTYLRKGLSIQEQYLIAQEERQQRAEKAKRKALGAGRFYPRSSRF